MIGNRRFKNSKLRYGIISLLCILVLTAVTGVVTAPNRWARLNALITVNGIQETNARAYRSTSGKTLVLIPQRGGNEAYYVITPQSNVVFFGGRSNFIMFPLFAFDRGGEYGVKMSDPKMDKDPKLLVLHKQIIYTSIENERIRIKWI